MTADPDAAVDFTADLDFSLSSTAQAVNLVSDILPGNLLADCDASVRALAATISYDV